MRYVVVDGQHDSFYIILDMAYPLPYTEGRMGYLSFHVKK
jgi:hypothetical protein